MQHFRVQHFCLRLSKALKPASREASREESSADTGEPCGRVLLMAPLLDGTLDATNGKEHLVPGSASQQTSNVAKDSAREPANKANQAVVVRNRPLMAPNGF